MGKRKPQPVLPVIDEWSIRRWRADAVFHREITAAIEKHRSEIDAIEAEQTEEQSG